jgi:hypothetical protein
VSAQYAAPNCVHSEAKASHLERVSLRAAPWTCDVMVRETIAARHIIHAAEVGEEIRDGGEMGQVVADLHTPLIIFAGSPTQDAVIRAELSIWRLKRVGEINLADDGRVFTN